MCAFRVTVRETDLFILAVSDLSELATQAVVHYRTQIEAYVQKYPTFQTSFEPVEVEAQAPPDGVFKIPGRDRYAIAPGEITSQVEDVSLAFIRYFPGVGDARNQLHLGCKIDQPIEKVSVDVRFRQMINIWPIKCSDSIWPKLPQRMRCR